MADSVRAAVSDRLRPRSILGWLVVVTALWWLFDESTVQVGMTLATSAIVGLADVSTEAYDLRSDVETLGLGFVMLLGGVSLFAFGTSVGVAIVFALAGGWMALDAGQVLRHEGWKATDDHDDRDGHDVYHEYVVRRVDSELRERALTRRELFDALDADDRAIDRALDVLAERGLLSRNGSELRVSSPPQPGTFERARSGIAAPFARLAQPLTIEFADGATDGDTRPQPVEEAISEGKRERERKSA